MFESDLRSRFAIFAFTLILLPIACSNKDENAPPAPYVDPVLSPTTLPTQIITGSAEYGATVKITGGLSEVEVTADPFTALFRAEVDLVTTVPAGQTKVATNLDVVAIDQANNASDATPVEILYSDPSPFVRITAINGYNVCSDGTLQTTVPADCSNADPGVTFLPGQTVEVVVEIDIEEDHEIVQVAINANGSGVSQQERLFVPWGAYTAGTTIEERLYFNVNGGAFNGDALVVAEALDASGMIRTSRAALLRVDIGIRLSGTGRTLTVISGGGLLTNPSDIAYDSASGSIYIANDDAKDSLVMKISGAQISIFSDFVDPPTNITVDSLGNLFVVSNNNTEIWKVAPDGTHPVDPFLNADKYWGVQTLNQDVPATGHFTFTGGGNNGIDQDCVTIGIAVYELNDITGGGTADACLGAAGTCSVAQTHCVNFDSAVQDDGLIKLAAAIEANGTSEVSAGVAQDCDTNGSGEPCVVLIAKVAGSATTLTLAADGSITPVNVANGEDAELFYVGSDRVGSSVDELEAATVPAVFLNNYKLGQRADGIAAALRGTPERLFIYTINNGNDMLQEFDTATGTWRIVAQQGDGLRQPTDVVITANGCALVSSDRRGEIFLIDLNDPNPAGTVTAIASGFDTPMGLALEGTTENAALLVVDQKLGIAARITPTAATGDCF